MLNSGHHFGLSGRTMTIASLLPSNTGNPLLPTSETTSAASGDGPDFAALLAGHIEAPVINEKPGIFDNITGTGTSLASTSTLLGALLAKQSSHVGSNDKEAHPLTVPAEIVDTRILPLLQSKENALLRAPSLTEPTQAQDSLADLTSPKTSDDVPQSTFTEPLSPNSLTATSNPSGQLQLGSHTHQEAPLPTSDATSQAIPVLRPISEPTATSLPITQTTPSNLGATEHVTTLPNPGKSMETPAISSLLKATTGELTSALAPEAAKSAGTPEPFQLPPTGIGQSVESRPAPSRHDATQSIATPLHDPRWSQQLGDRLLWMSRGEIQSAQININPAQLGPIQINISLNGDQMTAHFISAHQEVRQILDDAMPRLREMLSGAGINLGQSNVGAQTQQQQGGSAFSMNGNSPRSGSEDVILSPNESNSTGLRPINQGRGLVDLFA